MLHHTYPQLFVVFLFAAACSSAGTQNSPSDATPGTGGTALSSTGGSISANGGATSPNGGSMGMGGSQSAGSSAGTGGSVSTGGAQTAGGSTGTGGAATSGGAGMTGGKLGTGGADASSGAGGTVGTGRALGTGGAVSTGGKIGTGGAVGPGDKGGSGGAVSTGGAAASGGTTPPSGGAVGTGGAGSTIPNDAKKIIYIGLKGSDSNPGTQPQPFATIQHAAAVAQPGTLIYMLDGTYPISAPVNINSPAGTAMDPIRLWAYPGAKVTLDFATATGAGKGLSVNSSYWHVKGLVVTNCPGRGIQVMTGDHITVEFCETHHNGDMGLVVSEGATNALILNCDSHHNVDVANNGENADGFGAKSNLGEGTIFRGCRAWANADDGWDLYNCPSAVRFENCWAYKNGDNFLNLTTFAGDGNGFKLGKSDFTTSHHVLVNTVAFGNLGGNGFEDNANVSGLTFYNCVAYNNPKAGFEALNVTSHVVKNNISYKNGKVDNILAGSDVSNNSWNGMTVTDADFASLDDSSITGPRNADGSLPTNDFLRLNPSSRLVDEGVNVGLPYKGTAPDLGAFECK